MLNIIYGEILKLRKSHYLAMLLTTSLGMVVLMNAAVLISKDKMRTFESYSYNVEQINFLIVFSILFCMAAAYFFIREYDEKTANVLYSYPFCRIKIFLGKLFVIYVMIAAVYFIQCIGIYFSYYKLFSILNKEQILLNVKASIYSMLFEMSLIPAAIFLANLKKNILIPITYGILTVIINGISDNKFVGSISYNPLIGPVSILKYYYENDQIPINNIAYSSVIFFVISIIACIYHFYKMDIN